MYEELNKCKDILTKFGGHRLAAGLSLEKENIAEFRRRLNENCTLTEEEMKEKVTIDMEMPFLCVTEELVKELELLEPFRKREYKADICRTRSDASGSENTWKEQKCTEDKGTGCKRKCHRSHAVPECGRILKEYGRDLRAHGGGCSFTRQRRSYKIAVTYYPDINEYMGKRTPQIVIHTLPLSWFLCCSVENHRLKIRTSNGILKVVF